MSASSTDIEKPSQEGSWHVAAFYGTAASLATFIVLLPWALSVLGVERLLRGLPQALAVSVMSFPLQIALLAATLVPAALAADGRALLERLSIKRVEPRTLLALAGIVALLFPGLGLLSGAFKLLLGVFGMAAEDQAAVRLALNCSPGALASLAIGAALFAPVAEELAFRKTIFEFARGFAGTIPAVMLSATAFACSHGSLLQFPSLFALGLTLQWAYLRWGSLTPCIIIHAMHNSLSLAALLALRAAGFHSTPF